ncbi:homocysteine S-methyltransferase family protein [Allokutzneria oryzae]|uniref:Homocysteine S-methyltransferase family protein n=1 Tax=Allokutzneria oryzae TaxID=1378989 RepID=A0ABV6A5S6_9PSEU
MSRQLPQLSQELFLTDSGLETDLIFNKGVDLPEFAAFPLLSDTKGRRALGDYYREHIAVAKNADAGFVLEAPTWRANPDWAARLGYDAASLAAANRDAVALMVELRDEADSGKPMVISGCVGPRGDGYQPDDVMTADDAAKYHQAQVDAFAEAEVDLVTALTMTTPAEALGVARAAKRAGLPSVVSFTLETDGNLPDGTTLADAIASVDADTPPAYYMVNCAHPSHFADRLIPGMQRLRGLRANASRRSHAELDEATELDDGDPVELADDYARLRAALPQLTILGGCCGTDVRHVAAIAGLST